MKLLLLKYVTTVLTIITVPLTLFLSCLLLLTTSGRLHCELVRILFLQDHRKPTAFLQLRQLSMRNTTRTSSVSASLLSKVGNILLVKATTLCIKLNIDDAPIVSRAHTHPSHLQTHSDTLFPYPPPSSVFIRYNKQR